MQENIDNDLHETFFWKLKAQYKEETHRIH